MDQLGLSLVTDTVRRSPDPGGTKKLRKAFSADARMQLNRLRAMLRQAIVDFNVLGLSGPSNFTFMAPAARINQFSGWLETAANASLDAKWWAHPWVDRAVLHGVNSARKEIGGIDLPIPDTFEHLHQMAHDELKGIIGALVQKTMRAAHSAVNRRLVPHQAFRELVKPLDGDIKNRLNTFVQFMAVKSRVHGKVAYYRHVGVTHVGINPEIRLPFKSHDHSISDARRRRGDDVSEVGWQTAEDDLVCDACEEMAAGSPYTLDEITDLIPLHPWCRCDPVVWDDSETRDSLRDEKTEFTQDPTSGRFTGSVGHGSSTEKKKTKADDFEKAKIALPFHRSKEATDRFVEAWDKHVGEEPTVFKHNFLGGIKNTTMGIDVTSPDYWRIEGVIQDDAGRRVGNYAREIDWKNKIAESAYFELRHGSTGQDTGKNMLAGNVAMYQKLGLKGVKVHANIDVGGYAWAKYGYVPTASSWASLKQEILGKLGRTAVRSSPSGSSSTFEPTSWDEINSDDQDRIRDAWMNSTHSEFLENEVNNWRENGVALHTAKQNLADSFDTSNASRSWAHDVISEWHKENPTVPYTEKQIIDSISVKYTDDNYDGQADPEITFDDDKLKEPSDAPPKEQLTLPGFDQPDLSSHLTEKMRDFNRMRYELTIRLTKAFNDQAGQDESDVEPPSYLSESVGESQDEVWGDMSERDRYRWANRNNELPQYHGSDDEDENEDLQSVPPHDQDLVTLVSSNNPKAIWAIADSPRGKELLLNSDWYGVLNLTDKESMDRFNAYVGKKKATV